MAELRLTGPTQDGRALRLAAPDGTQHLLPLSPYLHRLVVEHDVPTGDAATAEAAPTQSDPAPAPDTESATTPDAEPATTPPADPVAVPSAPPVAPPSGDAVHQGPAVARLPPAGAPPARPAAPAGGPRAVRPVTDQEDVRTAASQEAPPLPPREIQARLRAGASVEQVARESGNSYARIRTYGFPVLAERGWVAQQAQAVEIWVGGPDLYSSTVTDGGPSTLGTLAAHRLDELGVDTAGLEWDAWREHSGDWTVTVSFSLAGCTGRPTPEDPPARWSFRPTAGHLDPQNAWARILSDAEAWNVFSSPASSEEAPAEDGDDAAAEPEVSAGPQAEGEDELLEILRMRRGRRVGADAESDDALAHLLARGAAERAETDETAPGGHRRDGTETVDAAEEAAGTHDAPAPVTGAAQGEPAAEDAPVDPQSEPRSRAARLLRGLPTPPVDGETGGSAAPFTLVDHMVEETTGDDAVDGPDTADAAGIDAPAGDAPRADAPPADEADAAPARAPRPAMPVPTPRPKARSASRRASVPSWDDIVFGRKND